MNAKVVKSAARTVLVFEFFSRIRRPATASEVEDSLQIPQSSASVLLRSLVRDKQARQVGADEVRPFGRDGQDVVPCAADPGQHMQSRKFARPCPGKVRVEPVADDQRRAGTDSIDRQLVHRR